MNAETKKTYRELQAAQARLDQGITLALDAHTLEMRALIVCELADRLKYELGENA